MASASRPCAKWFATPRTPTLSAGGLAALTRAIVGLLSDPDRLRSYSERSRQLFADEFRAQTSNQRLLDLFSKVAGTSAQ